MNKFTAKGKVIASILGVAILSIGLMAGIFLVKKNQDIREKAAPSTSLTISPATQNKNPGNTFTVNVVANSGSNLISGVDLYINYDKNSIQIDSVTKGSGISGFGTEINKKIDPLLGKIAYSAFTLDPATFANGSNLNLLTISGSILDSATSGESSISFDARTAIAGSQEGQDIVVSKSGAKIVVQGLQQSSGPTATSTSTSLATVVPTGTSTSTSMTATPTGTSSLLSATATSTSTATSKPTSTATSTTKATATSTSASTATLSLKETSTPFPIPVSGVNWPSIFGVLVGTITILGSLLLVF